MLSRMFTIQDFSQCEILEGILSSRKMGLSLKPEIHRANVNEYRLWRLG